MSIQISSPAQDVTGRILGQWSKVRLSFPFAANVAVLTGGASLGHCFTVAAAPLLTRLYLPHDIGNLGLFTEFLAVTAVAASLQYDVAIVSASDEREAAHLATLSMLLALPMSVAGGLLLYVMIHFSLVGFGVLPAYAAGLMVPTILFAGLFSVLRYWSLRDERFGIVSHAVVLQNGGRSVLQIALGVSGLHSFGLLLGEVCGRGIGMSRMMRNAWPVMRKYALSSRDGAKALTSNRQFPLYSMPSSLLNQLGTSLPLPLLVTLYGADAGGYYTLVWRVLAVPVVLVGASIADAFHSRAALYAREDPKRLLRFFHSTSAALLAMGIVPALTVFIFGEPIFAFAFGMKWKLSGTIAVIVAPWFLTSFIVSPLSRLVYVLRGQRLKLIYDVLILGGNLMVFVFARHLGWTMLHMVTIMSGVNTASKIVYYLVLLRIAATAMRPSSMRLRAA
jgi:O-antigen/teichoic acid export membrane protein